VLDLIDLLGQRDDCARSLLIALQQLVAGSAPATDFLGSGVLPAGRVDLLSTH